MSWLPMCFARPSFRMYASDTDVRQARHVAPVRPTVPSSPSAGPPTLPLTTSKRTRSPDPFAAAPTTVGAIYDSLPLFLLSHQDFTSGMSIAQAGLGQVTVRAQIHAMTDALVPSSSSALGYR